MMDSRPIRIVFFGTPAFATPALRALAADRRFEIALVVTLPDRPAGRGHKLISSPVKQTAHDLDLRVYQPSSLKTESERSLLHDADADFFVVAAFGMIFGANTLAIPRLGCVNLHASLLPKFRGASPIAAAIACGETETGVTLMQMELGLDTGPIVAAAAIDISQLDTTESLSRRLAQLGASMMEDKLVDLAVGRVVPSPQPDTGASVVRPLVKDDGWLDWDRPAADLERWVRAMWPWPRAWTTLNGERFQVHRASPTLNLAASEPGVAIVDRDRPRVGTSDGTLELEIVQLPGGRPIPGSALAQARLLKSGTRLGVEGRPGSRAPFVTKL